MGQIAFWSPVGGQAGSTANISAVATVISMEYMTKTLMSHTHWDKPTLESTFIRNKDIGEGEMNYATAGMDALERLVRSQKLTPELVRDFTTPILANRLDLMTGTTKSDTELFGSISEVVNSIFDAAKQFYDVSLIDVNNGFDNSFTNTVIYNSDLIVVNLNQNQSVLEQFFNGCECNGLLKDKEYVIVLGQYDRNSKYNIGHIKRTFKCDNPMYTIPHNTGYMDAINDRSVLEFFLKNKNIRPVNVNYHFMNDVRKCAKGILDASGIDTKIYSERGA
ncbi:hypothetical protein [Paenibacillus antarcticus]|uniref:Uncharacterized protein n=1 Tax=Paenibacillus antarcticus TaxID=253703 RepID=A0A168JXX4_9BACL|nr:hypothetical protein [Paenibacillus antarcticus]OAB41251.1 hypothetical protein PBAT_22135 [Paenibacillus antarcticus]